MDIALPNLHPALVHFPIALISVALLGDILLALRRLPDAFDTPTAVLWALAALSGLAAYIAGESAHEAFENMGEVVHQAMEAHEEAALPALVLIFGVAGLRAFDLWSAARTPGRTPRWRWTALAMGIGAQVLILRAADLGGGLVYQHGVGVEAPAQPPSAPDAHPH
jgi:uncharacterized membrane protein